MGPAGCFVLKEAQVTGIKITKKKVGNERYDNLLKSSSSPY